MRILFIHPKSVLLVHRDILESFYEYQFTDLFTGSFDGWLSVLNTTAFDIVVVSSECSYEHIQKFLYSLSMTPALMSVKVILYITSSVDVSDLLHKGLFDVVSSNDLADVIANRFELAYQRKESINYSDMENILRVLPSNIFLKDEKGRYIFSTQYWHHLEHPDNPNWNIRGKTDVDIRKDKDNAILALKADLQIIKKKKGTRYQIKIDTDGLVEYYDVIKEPLINSAGKVTGIVGLLNNVTDSELLKQKLKNDALFDGLTGLLRRGVFETQLSEVFHNYKDTLEDGGTPNPFCVLMLDIDHFKSVNDTYGHDNGDIVLSSFANLLQRSCNSQIQACRWGGEEFMLLLKDMDRAAGLQVAEKIRVQFSELSYPEVTKIPNQTVSIGLAEISPADTETTLVKKADNALYFAKNKGRNQVYF